ncbi:MAG: ribose-phosphate diphosphokinase [Spirochaetaceae bacterium]|jgi:ribose-phosphate pyrophosphokinase|nr:ribose-phosphate diphosphokinase [Spirochaetaceae bacterium]
MKYTGPEHLAILACPGGEVFADEVILHLKKRCHHKFNKAVSDMAKKYALDMDTAMRYISFIYDALRDEAGIYTPRFKTSARFIMFPNGEIKTEILEPVRGKDVYIVQDPENRYPVRFNDGALKKHLSVNDHLMTVLVTVDAVKQAGAERITLVTPVYPYSRQHKKKGREGVTASRIGYILESLGVDRIITLDIHSREIGNGFNFMRMENLHASYQIIRQLSKIAEIRSGDFVVVSPDTGAVDRNKFYATAFKKPLALLYKERDYSRVSKDAHENNIAEIKLLGNVRDKTVFMADDMLGTGGTLLKAMQFLREQGAKKVIAGISLPLFSGNAIEHFDAAFRDGLFYRIIGTNAVYQEELLTREWYVSVNITKLFAQTISRLHQDQSLSSLLDNREIIEKLLADT